jgi:hypothetical protein
MPPELEPPVEPPVEPLDEPEPEFTPPLELAPPCPPELIPLLDWPELTEFELEFDPLVEPENPRSLEPPCAP